MNEEIFSREISEKLKSAKREKHYTQNFIQERCKSEFGIEISQSSISKIFNGKMEPSLYLTYALCKILNIDITLTGRAEKPDPAKELPGVPVERNLIINPQKSAFNQYIGFSYDIFFHSTISKENRLIEGTLYFANKDNKYCSVTLKIQATPDQIKEYTGRMTISETQKAAFCILSNDLLGETGAIFFRHRSSTKSSLKCKIAVAVTISAGKRNPTVQRMFICKKDVILNAEQKKIIASQLLFNDSQIRISENSFKDLDLNEDSAAVIKKIRKSEKIFTIDENALIAGLEAKDWDDSEIYEIMAKLRINSTAHKYNKIGEKSDDKVFDYFFR